METPKIYVRDGKVYVVRPVFEGGECIGGEHATFSPYNGLSWTPHESDAELSEMEPLGDVSGGPE